MRASLLLVAGLLAATPAFADAEFPATLAGHAILPADTFIAPPADAPADLQVSGKFTGAARTDALGTIMGLSAGRPTGLSVPFRGQPVQGHSGIRRMADGTYWVLTDNGFGNKRNSPDAMLFLSHYRFDFEKGTIERIATVFLSDPDKKVPFRIANEGTDRRYLTGADFDPESFQIINGKIWIGEEFGPFLIRADMTGKIEAIFETQVDGQVARSPDHPAVTTPNAPGGAVDFRVRRSKGFEGMAASPDGRFLYRCWRAPCGIPPPVPSSRSTAANICASSSSMCRPAATPAATGSTSSMTTACRSATST